MINIKIITNISEKKIILSEPKLLSDVLKETGVNITFPCGGKGVCGKCRVKISNGDMRVLHKDELYINDRDLKEGYRLACYYNVSVDTIVEILENYKFDVLTDYAGKSEALNSNNNVNRSMGDYAIAIDIGTTTVAFELSNIHTSDTIQTFSCLNSQQIYGADVLSRITASNEGKIQELKNSIIKDLIIGIKKLTENINIEGLFKIAICANTAMTYMLLGKDCRLLGVNPFKNDIKETLVFNFKDIFGNEEETNLKLNKCNVYVFPCISGFIGGDIVSGGVLCDIDKKGRTFLIDIGTNAEMLLNDGKKLIATSASAGPALEGGNISCGVGSIDGAISSVELIDGKFKVRTINDKKPVGICGSGLIDVMSVLLENKYIDETGLLAEEYFEAGVEICNAITVTQNDIRQFQLAKAAIRAGIESIFMKSTIKTDEIEDVFVAGGLGFNINLQNAFKTGLFPKEFAGKIRLSGNTALGGLNKYLYSESMTSINFFVNKTEDFNLSEMEEFSEMFVGFMGF